VGKKEYDFAGWVTKNDILCADGVTIKHDAFRDNDGKKVPLVWNHNYNNPNNILGHVMLQNEPTGVYGYGYFNETEEAKNAKELVKHGDISSMSIGARKLKRAGSNIIHGLIYEVSLVLSGANPGAMIETVVQHSDNADDEHIVMYPGTLIHSADDILEHKSEGGTTIVAKETNTDKTIGDILETMSEEQQEAVYALVGMVSDDEDDDDDDFEEDDDMKQNVFNQQVNSGNEGVLKHGLNEALRHAMDNKVPSLKEVLDTYKAEGHEETITHGINSIEILFPEAAQSTNGNVPILYKDPNTFYRAILSGVTKSPFSRVKTLVADLTEDEARAKGYIKGNMKKEEFFSLIRRQTGPTTIYKKQKLDRDDIIDITDFDVVAFMNVEMRMMLEEEIARAILIGDGRDIANDDKINENNIRPIISDNEFFTIHRAYPTPAEFVDSVIMSMSDYRGSGNPDMFIDPTLLASVKLLKGTDGRYLFGDIPSNEFVAARLGIRSIIPTTFMVGRGALIVNLSDYTVGASRGGQITTFDDFDIDFNQHKYLIETRLSGSLTIPKSAIHFAPTTAAVGATADFAGLVYGDREADKPAETPPV
jgi:HK97 family phage prohead protease